MLDWIIITYSILFLGCASWRERQYLRSNRFLIERILLIFIAFLFLIVKLSYFEDIFSNIFQLKTFEVSLLGLAYMLFYNLLIQKIIDYQNFDHKNARVQKRLLYKLPLVGMLSGIAINNYYGQMPTNLLFMIYVLFLLVLIYKNFKKAIVGWQGLIFSILTIMLFLSRMGYSVLLYDLSSLLSDVVFTLSVFVMLEIFNQKVLKNAKL